MKVSEVMTAQVVTAKPSSTLVDIARTMSEVETGVVPVVDDGRLVGLVTDRDIVIRAVAEGRGLDTKVADIMSDDVETCREDDNVADAAAKMGSNQIRRLVVLNDQGRIAGILSLGDIALDYGAKVVGKTLEEISEPVATPH